LKFALDHLVVVVDSLAGATAAFGEAGFTVTPGGRHDAVATENALVVFADGTYFELLAACERESRESLRELRTTDRWAKHLHDSSAIARRFLPALAGPDGVADFAVRTSRLDALATESRRRGYAWTGPVAMSRRWPDGELLEWRMLFPAERWLPFVISDRTPIARRIPDDAPARVHANGASGIARVTVRTPGLVSTAMGYVDHFGASLTPRLDGGADVVFEGVRLTLVEGEPAGACAASIAGVRVLPPAIAALGLAPGD
jgi:hypothetical protein